MVKIVLFTNACKFDNRNQISNFASLTAQSAYFDSLTHIEFTDVKIRRLNQPVLLDIDYDTIQNYVYGYIQFDEKRYYFSVTRYEIETTVKTWLYYELDYWETYRYDKLKIGKSVIRRCTLELPFVPLTKIGCDYQNYKSKYNISTALNYQNGLYGYAQIILTYHDDADNENWIYLYVTDDMDNVIPNWSNLGLNPSNIVSAWLMPLMIPPAQYLNWTTVSTGTHYELKKVAYSYLAYHAYLMPWTFQFNCKSDIFDSICLTDAQNNIVYTYPKIYTGTLEIHFRLFVSMTSITYRGYFYDSTIPSDNVDLSNWFTVPLIPIDVFTDAYTDYAVREKAYLIEQREIQREESLVNSISNLGQSATSGFMAGSLAGAGAGPYGALLSTAMDLQGALTRYLSSGYFNDRTTDNEDRHARVANDSLRITGNEISGVLNDYTGIMIYSIEPDDNSRLNMNNQIATYGYSYNSELDPAKTLQLLTDNPSFSFIGDIELSGIQTIGIDIIRTRLKTGVTFSRG